MKCSKKRAEFVCKENRFLYSANMLAKIETNNVSQKDAIMFLATTLEILTEIQRGK